MYASYIYGSLFFRYTYKPLKHSPANKEGILYAASSISEQVQTSRRNSDRLRSCLPSTCRNDVNI